MLTNFQAYEQDSTTNFVILKSNGRAFCAGGDVVAVLGALIIGHWSFGANFYRKQYALDYLLATYEKPLISLINGVVMGGGAGLSMHAKFRIVTENAVFAMPEASIGLFPDVGASYFLSRLPGYFGEYLGLTGARLDGMEMLACGLATHFVLSKDLVLLENELDKVGTSDTTEIARQIERFSCAAPIKRESAYARLDTINKCFSKNTVEDILLALIKKGREQTLEQCLRFEYIVACNILRGSISKDFWEGGRAKLIEKDNKPKWAPSNLQSVSEETVNRYFTEVDDPHWEILRLPDRPNLVDALKSKITENLFLILSHLFASESEVDLEKMSFLLEFLKCALCCEDEHVDGSCEDECSDVSDNETSFSNIYSTTRIYNTFSSWLSTPSSSIDESSSVTRTRNYPQHYLNSSLSSSLLNPTRKESTWQSRPSDVPVEYRVVLGSETNNPSSIGSLYLKSVDRIYQVPQNPRSSGTYNIHSSPTPTKPPQSSTKLILAPCSPSPSSLKPPTSSPKPPASSKPSPSSPTPSKPSMWSPKPSSTSSKPSSSSSTPSSSSSNPLPSL
ncbi:Beta-hydroxyisobutyryl-CoA hydrolase 1, putative [Theobroma cacao]|uniref:3-hydroxyisobutyryl-CoA hydrolase n=1 Tax=Theobroma cacao TaxID=3641 RepID=A0A061E291_THECC|nr:Beta-hydroxyisobutyryl-CoA hydrolase 1, putative [Theobroma cacao]